MEDDERRLGDPFPRPPGGKVIKRIRPPSREWQLEGSLGDRHRSRQARPVGPEPRVSVVHAGGWLGSSGFSGDQPGQVKVIELDGSSGWTAESRAFVCAESTVNYDINFAGLALGYRAKDGYIFENFTGTGTVVLAGGGSLIELIPRTTAASCRCTVAHWSPFRMP